MKHLFVLVTSLCLSLCAWADNPKVEMKTNQGTITIELYQDKAPKTVANFLDYTKKGFYSGTIFHRVIDNFMIQGGGHTADMTEKPTGPSIINEAGNGLKNETGTLAMARKPDPDSASAQFFINLKDNGFLDHRDNTPAGFGYCVFGRVVQGMDVVNKIAKLPTTDHFPHQNVPVEAVVIESVKLLEAAKPDAKAEKKTEAKAKVEKTATDKAASDKPAKK